MQIIVEVQGGWGPYSSCIEELEFWFEGNKVENTTVTEQDNYNNVNNSTDRYWNDNVWDKSNLFDGGIHYSSGSTTVFIHRRSGTIPEDTDWSRFMVDLGKEAPVDEIAVWVGNSTYQIPKKISFYQVLDDYSKDSHLVARSNEGLVKLGEVECPKLNTPTRLSISVTSIFNTSLIKNFDGSLYSLVDNTLIETELNQSAATQLDFETYGMTDLSPLTTPTTKVILSMEQVGAAGAGKVFRKSIDATKIRGIKNIKNNI